jgi:ribosomal protein S27E
MRPQIEVRCLKCGHYICSAPESTPIRAYCRDCNLKFEVVTKSNPYMAPRRA